MTMDILSSCLFACTERMDLLVVSSCMYVEKARGGSSQASGWLSIKHLDGFSCFLCVGNGNREKVSSSSGAFTRLIPRISLSLSEIYVLVALSQGAS